jgi:aspartate/methionine/tyrosine aminotransferase
MVPGPAQAAAVTALADQDHVLAQRRRYRHRLERLAAVLARLGLDARLPDGGFYLWVPAPGGSWALASRLAAELGVVVSPGEFYGDAGAGHVRLAAVQPDELLDLVESRVG